MVQKASSANSPRPANFWKISALLSAVVWLLRPLPVQTVSLLCQDMLSFRILLRMGILHQARPRTLSLLGRHRLLLRTGGLLTLRGPTIPGLLYRHSPRLGRSPQRPSQELLRAQTKSSIFLTASRTQGTSTSRFCSGAITVSAADHTGSSAHGMSVEPMPSTPTSSASNPAT